MIEITHHRARALLQVAADRPLAPADKAKLDAHLAACTECRAYADRLTVLEENLRKATHNKWDPYRPNLNLQAIKNPSPAQLIWNNLFSQANVLGKVTILAALLLGYVLIINFVGIRVPIIDDQTPTVLPTPNGFTSTSDFSPTPSLQSARTDLASPACTTVIYIVQENDTLESIAVHYGITKEIILEYNQDAESLVANTVFAGMDLAIPVCKSAPSRTASLPGNVLTITPIHGTILPDQPE